MTNDNVSAWSIQLELRVIIQIEHHALFVQMWDKEHAEFVNPDFRLAVPETTRGQHSETALGLEQGESYLYLSVEQHFSGEGVYLEALTGVA